MFSAPGNRNHWSGWDLGIEPTAGRITQCGDRRWRNSAEPEHKFRERSKHVLLMKERDADDYKRTCSTTLRSINLIALHLEVRRLHGGILTAR